MLAKPFNVYINWGAYDELSDSVPLTEEVAMRQLGALLRLRARGVRLDSYLMDAFSYAPDGAYRAWRKPHWPQGPGRWLEGCLEEGIKPGLWFSGNTLCKLKAAPQWRDSLDADGRGSGSASGGLTGVLDGPLGSTGASGSGSGSASGGGSASAPGASPTTLRQSCSSCGRSGGQCPNRWTSSTPCTTMMCFRC